MDDFWLNDISILYKKYYDIIPIKNMSENEKINAITRLMLYFIILIILFQGNQNYIIVAIVAIIVVTVFHYIGNNNKNKNLNTHDTNDIADNNNVNNINDNTNNVDSKYLSDKYIDKKTIFDNPIFEKTKNKYKDTIESGYIDSDGNYVIGKEYGPFTKNKKNNNINDINVDVELNDNYPINIVERKPTVDNPYQNIVFSDYLNNKDAPQPCNVDSSQVQTEAQNLYNSSMFRNTSDVFERENSQRIFMTMPISTNPSDQTNFANWLFKTGPTCKENTQNCTYYETPEYISQRY